MSGKLIVFEGVEGCGKTTQMQLCNQWLHSLSVSVVLTREPGGTELGSHLRRLLLEKSEDKPVGEVTELLLYAADRAQHIEQELKPNLAAGKYILCDRYTDSTIAYQGYGRGLSMSIINQLNNIATGGLESDLTIWLDVDVEVGLARKRGSEAALDRIEQEAIAFHHRVQQGYTELAATYPARIFRVDGSLSKEVVQHTIKQILSDRFFNS
ncbi:dTMP kinase [Anabaena cylindrica FACHB-243]|uniref:Thymidylate kinase n=1 Tax=Anabaena cylindrica (strain ATCC 27899 / PCC 7122) TaxID=272123 RepID=K9ZNG9_ANACC|nr:MULTISPECIES: dTMP kinase [Anabaena]AFZ60736.1 thymidylate kinase [Anabaena cylindrica PCC 7122]MBD2418393.1 dTMP kinase [Anabaena cylindrica FACHB-243]MBY5280858.1 dTMP kinase [Anabaena sp. CCAP 1446/1C]MBY5311055.1 dTMP kinase [Anabaena sp. CCAP 1446/1C]MCM2408724.1 dTMP kinase [Anabaena sp. CCAP 1446/1C]